MKNNPVRLDAWLAHHQFLYNFSRSQWSKIIRQGWVQVNQRKVKPHFLVSSQDKITFSYEAIERWRKEKEIVMPNTDRTLEIVFQNKNILIVNKPAGLQIHPDHHERKNTLVNILISQFPEIKKVGENPERPGIVHRLDKETSGLIVIARNQKTFQILKKLFQQHKIIKKYQAIVFGSLPQKEGIINVALTRSRNYKKQIVANAKVKAKIRPALTRYKVLKEKNNFSWLELQTYTGRTHQIRVHLQYLGNPLVGDKLYKLKKFSLENPPSRHLLHAYYLEFFLKEKRYVFQIKLPQDMEKFLKKTKI